MQEKEIQKEFLEVRRLNSNVQIGTYRIAKNFDETLKLYVELQDQKYKRSAPIPPLEENEYLLAIQPKLKKELYGDIEIIKITEDGNLINIYYKEIKSDEYLAEKQKNPIVIVKISGKVPARVQLISN